MKPSRATDAVRANETTEEQLQRFYRLLEYQIQDKEINWNTLHNIDERGVAEGETQAGSVVGSSLTPFSVVSERFWYLGLYNRVYFSFWLLYDAGSHFHRREPPGPVV